MMVSLSEGLESMPIDRNKNFFGSTELVEKHDENALEGHLIKVLSTLLLVFKANSDNNSENLVQQINLRA